jgi:hypothetical protein
MTTQLAVTALRTAVARRQPTGVGVVHSERGSQTGQQGVLAALGQCGFGAVWT